MAPSKRILDSNQIATLFRAVKNSRPVPFDSKQPIQGKPRESRSNAFKEHVKRETVRLQKAMNTISHGKHIFVYHNVRTKQVVYSLTRYLEENNVLRQMIYHGKKTVPADLRRDMWIPYYSVHFGDARLGLRAYQLLREFSMQRQLSPPPEMITVTKEFLDAKRPKDPTAAEEFDRLNMKRIGHPMEKKERARVLMDQKATSVADIGAVLTIQHEEVENGFLERESKRGPLTRKARKRCHEAREREQARAKAYAARIKALERHLNPRKLGEADDAYPKSPEAVKVLWRDVHDAQYAESWPASVEHGELETPLPGAVFGSERQLLVPDEVVTEHGLEEQRQ